MTDNGEETERMASDTTDERPREASARVQAHEILGGPCTGPPGPGVTTFHEHGTQCDRLTSALVAHAREVDACRAEVAGLLPRFLRWRGIDEGVTPCKGCGGAGTRTYGSTATWRGGIGGQMVTADVCDKCWGSGDTGKPWLNLRAFGSAIAERDALRAELLALRVELNEMKGRDQ